MSETFQTVMLWYYVVFSTDNAQTCQRWTARKSKISNKCYDSIIYQRNHNIHCSDCLMNLSEIVAYCANLRFLCDISCVCFLRCTTFLVSDVVQITKRGRPSTNSCRLGVKQFKCPTCNKLFSQKGTLPIFIKAKVFYLAWVHFFVKCLANTCTITYAHYNFSIY